MLIRTLLVLLFAMFGTVAAFAAPGDWTRVSYPVKAPEFCALPVKLTNTVRAPPTTSADVMATGTAFAQTGNLRALDGAENSGEVYALLRSSIAPNRTLDDIIAGGQRLPSTGGRTTQIQKTGGFDQANADFDALGLNNVRDIRMPNGGTGRVGELSDGTRVVVRSTSSDRVAGHTSQPTLEIQGPDGPTKIRY